MSCPIQCRELSKKFRKVLAVDRLDLDVPEGAIYGLVGTNGAGKTTTIKTLMNILRPSSGQATVFGVDSRRLRAADFARIGYVSENQKLPAWMTVDDLMAYCRPFYPSWDEALCHTLVNNIAANVRQPVHISFARTEVTTFNRIVK